MGEGWGGGGLRDALDSSRQSATPPQPFPIKGRGFIACRLFGSGGSVGGPCLYSPHPQPLPWKGRDFVAHHCVLAGATRSMTLAGSSKIGRGRLAVAAFMLHLVGPGVELVLGAIVLLRLAAGGKPRQSGERDSDPASISIPVPRHARRSDLPARNQRQRRGFWKAPDDRCLNGRVAQGRRARPAPAPITAETAYSAVPGSAILRCCSASIAAGVTWAVATCGLFFQPETTWPSPAIIASQPSLATSAGSSFSSRADLGVHHVGALEEFGLGRARHQAGDRDAAVLELVAQRVGEAVDEGLGAVVDRLEACRA